MNKKIVSVATLAAVILGVLIAFQFENQRTEDLAQRIQEERLNQANAVLENLQQENAALLEENKSLLAELDKIKSQEGSNPLIMSQLAQLKISDGTSQVVGPGVKMTIHDSGQDLSVIYPITTDDLRRIINTLRFAGAEAVSVNGQRIVAGTSIVLSGNSTILINSVPISKIGSTTYEILAIGEQTILADYLNQLEVITLKQAGMKVDVLKEEVTIPSYKGNYRFDYSSKISS